MLDFARPIWLLLLLALPLICWLALRFSYASLGPFQRWLSLIIRCAIWVLLSCALAGVQFVRISDRVSVMVVRDSSDSVDTAQSQAIISGLEAARKQMRKDDSLGKLNFGANALLEFLPQPGVSERQLHEWQTQPRTNFTNISEALQVAVAAFPANAQKRLVLLTDGNENNGNALTEARVARDNNVEIYVVPVPSVSGPEVILASLDAPARAALGEMVRVRFVLDSTVATQADVSLIRNGEFLDRTRINVRPGKEVYEFPVRIDQSGFFTYELAVEPEVDSIAENNRAYTFSVVGGQPRLLYATGDPNERNFLPSTFRTNNIAVDVVSPAGIPYSMEDFQNYDGIIFSDVAAFDISNDQMKMIQLLVRDFGKGFMMLGGDKSFGPGGYFDTPIEETLPVDMDFRRKKITPSSLVICLIDKSGSMGATVQGVMKIDMAKEACKQVVKLQGPDDWVGVMGFDGVGQWVVEPTKGINKEATLNAISSMQAGGGTVLGPALRASIDAARDIPAQIKHFIVFTDGIVAPDDFEAITNEMKELNITLSNVAFGSDADLPFMRELAKLGGGNMYEAQSLHDLPKIFTREVFMANKATLNEEPFTALPNGDSPLISAIGWGSAPNLYGYVATSAKDDAQVPLLTPKEDPLLAVWRYGLGKSAAWTSDAKNRWARDWLGWGGYERFWTGVGRWIRSDLDSQGLVVQTAISGGEAVVTASVTDRSSGFVNQGQLEARVTDPELGERTVPLQQVGPGQYSGRFPLGNNGNYFVNVVQMAEDNDGEQRPIGAQAAGLSLSYSPEYKNLERNTFLLTQLQDSSLALPGVTLEGLFTEQRRPQRRLEDAWELFALIAIWLWLLDVAARRLVLNWQDAQLLFAAVVAGPAGRRALAAKEALGGLVRAKQRVATGLDTRGQSQEVGSVQARIQQRREELQRKSELSAVKSVLPPSPSVDADDGTGSSAKPATTGAASELSSLRERFANRDRETKTGATAEFKLPPRDTNTNPAGEPHKAQRPSGDAEFTSELLKRKRQDWRDE